MFEVVLTLLFVCGYYFFGNLYVKFLLTFVYLLLVFPGVYSMFFGAPYIPTSDKKMKKILEMGDFKKDDVVYDLGCGDGKLVRVISKRGVRKVVGYEFSVPTYFLAVLKKFFLKGNEIIRFGNFWKKDFSNADVIICFLLDRTMKDFERKIWPKLKKGTRVISNEFKMNEVVADIEENGVIMYVKK